MKNSLYKRYFSYAAIYTAIASLWPTVHGLILTRSVKDHLLYIERAQIYALDAQERILFDITWMFTSFINSSAVGAASMSAALCVLLHVELKQMHPGFLNVLPVRRKSYFDYAAAMGFACTILAQLVAVFVIFALLAFAKPLIDYISTDAPRLYLFIAKYWFSRFSMAMCFYGVCLLCQQLFNKPAAATGVSLAVLFAPRLVFGFADKLALALGYSDVSHSIGQLTAAALDFFPLHYNPFENPLADNNIYPLAGLIYLVTAAAFTGWAARLTPEAPAYAVGLYGFTWVKPAVFIGFAVCTAAAFASYLPRVMGFDTADFSPALMSCMFGLGLVTGYYAWKRLSVLLDN